MPGRTTVADSIVLTMLSLAASVTSVAGLLLAGFGAIAGAFDLGEATPIASRGLLGTGIALTIGGGAAVVVRRRAGARVDPQGSVKALLAATLAGVPIALAMWLSPLVDFWRDLLALATELGVWDQTDWSMSGLILVPAGVALAVPAIQAFTAVTVVVSSLPTMLLVLARSASLLRVLIVIAVLTGGQVIAGAYGTFSSDRLMPIAEQTIRNTQDPTGGSEQAQALALLERYQEVTQRSALTLGWVWVGLLVWVPLLAIVAPYRASSSDTADTAPAAPDIASPNATERDRADRDAARK